MLELRISAHVEAGVMSVGYGEPGTDLPRDARVLEPGVGEMVALGLLGRLTEERSVLPHWAPELDELVENAERIVAITRVRRRSWRDEHGSG